MLKGVTHLETLVCYMTSDRTLHVHRNELVTSPSVNSLEVGVLASRRHHDISAHRAEVESPVVFFLESAFEGGRGHLIALGGDDVAGVIAC